VWFDRSGKTSSTGVTGPVWEPAIAPDERSFAYSRDSGSNSDIWARDLVHGVDQRLTSDASQNNTPVWSPRGDRILFRSSRTGNQQQIFVQSSSGAGEAEALTKTPNNKFASQWSRDGRFIVITDNPGGGQDLLLLPFAEAGLGARELQVFLKTQFSEGQGQISPDGHWMAYASNDTTQREVYVRPFPAAEGLWRISASGGEQPRWRGDGKELFYVAPDGKMMAVDIKASPGSKPVFDRGAPKALFDVRLAIPPGNLSFSIRCDSRRKALPDRHRRNDQLFSAADRGGELDGGTKEVDATRCCRNSLTDLNQCPNSPRLVGHSDIGRKRFREIGTITRVIGGAPEDTPPPIRRGRIQDRFQPDNWFLFGHHSREFISVPVRLSYRLRLEIRGSTMRV